MLALYVLYVHVVRHLILYAQDLISLLGGWAWCEIIMQLLPSKMPLLKITVTDLQDGAF